MVDARKGRPYLNLQLVVTTNALAVHLVVSIVSIAPALVLDECEADLLLSADRLGCSRRAGME